MSEGHDSISNNLCFKPSAKTEVSTPNELTVLLTLESSIYVRQKPNSKRPLLLLDRSVKELPGNVSGLFNRTRNPRRPSPAESAHYTHQQIAGKGAGVKRFRGL
jgi:hypothetical protein